MKRYFGLLAAILTIFGTVGVRAQVTRSGDLDAHVDSIIAAMPTTNGGGDYLQPNAASRTLWREIIDHILVGEYTDAHTKALTKDYQVVLFTDTGSPGSAVHVVLERTPDSTSRYWGTFLFNTVPLRPNLVIQSPHPRYDSNTGVQSVLIYLHTQARALFVSGTHRCNGVSYSSCDGTTEACSETAEPYRYSDQCHVVLSTFQVTTEAMLDDDPSLLLVQPHGFGWVTGDPELVISNGTRYSPSGTDYAVAISDAIQVVDPSLTTKVVHIDLSWNKLLATWNTQGRLINGSSDPCGTAPTSSTGQFVHIEQKRVGLRDTEANRMKLAQAIAAAVPDVVTAAGSASRPPAARILGSYPNPFSGRTRIDVELGRSGAIQLDVFDVSGRRIVTLAGGVYDAGTLSLEWDARGMPSGIYFVRLRQDGVIAGIRKCVLLR